MYVYEEVLIETFVEMTVHHHVEGQHCVETQPSVVFVGHPSCTITASLIYRDVS